MINKIIKLSNLFYKLASIKEEYPEIHQEEKEIFNNIKKAILDIVIIGVGGISVKNWTPIFERFLNYFDPEEKDTGVVKALQNLLFAFKFGDTQAIVQCIILLWRYFYTPSRIEYDFDENLNPINNMLIGMSLVNIPGKSNKEKAILTLVQANQTNVKKFNTNDKNIIYSSDLSNLDIDELCNDPNVAYQILELSTTNEVNLDTIWPKTISKLIKFFVDHKSEYDNFDLLEDLTYRCKNSLDLDYIYDKIGFSTKTLNLFKAIFFHKFASAELQEGLYDDGILDYIPETITVREFNNIKNDKVKFSFTRDLATKSYVWYDVQKFLTTVNDEETQLNLAKNHNVSYMFIKYLSTASTFEAVRNAAKETLKWMNEEKPFMTKYDTDEFIED